MPHPTAIDRATFLSRAGALLGLAVLQRPELARLLPRRAALEHPEPREGITSDHVLTDEAIGSKLLERKLVADGYEAARTYPGLFDGVACACSCGGKRGSHRSLLSCYETMQPTGCGGCQEEAEIVGRLAKESKSLAEIRAAVDKWNA